MSNFNTHHALKSDILVATSRHRGGWRALIAVVEGRDHDDEADDVRKHGLTLDEHIARAIFGDYHFAHADYTG